MPKFRLTAVVVYEATATHNSVHPLKCMGLAHVVELAQYSVIATGHQMGLLAGHKQACPK